MFWKNCSDWDEEDDNFFKGVLCPIFSGFTEVKAACCGLGELNAEIPCLPISNVCSNRKDHIFWDPFHPTEVAARIFVEKLFDGPSKYTSPVSMRQLVDVLEI